MRPSQLVSSYKSVAVTTASPGQLVLMLFDGALRFLSVATHGFQLENIALRNEQIHNNLVKAQKIIRELQCSLDMKVEGDFPKTMFALYEFMIEQLQTANIAKDVVPIGVVERLLGEVRGAWAQMLEQSATVAA
jgi:flagellar protein FliS